MFRVYEMRSINSRFAPAILGLVFVCTTMCIVLGYAIERHARTAIAATSEVADKEYSNADGVFWYICNEHGVYLPDAPLDQQTAYGPIGRNLSGLSNTFMKAGLSAQISHSNWSEVKEAHLPIILGEKNNLLILDRIDGDALTVIEPNGLKKIVNLDEALQNWDGTVMQIDNRNLHNPLPQFVPIEPGMPAMQYSSLLVDAGEVNRAAGQVKFEFPFVNVGLGDLRLEKVVPSCGCVKVDYPLRPIVPGTEGKIIATYDIGGSVGSFGKVIAVQTNDPRFPVVQLKLSGYVVDELVASPLYVNFGRIRCGEVTTQKVILRYYSRHDFSHRKHEI